MKNHVNNREGDLFRCVASKSNFYTTGETYTLVKNGGVFGFIAKDGLFDPLGKTLSKFSKITPGRR